MRVAIIGGTGSFGKALARRLVEADVDVIVGSRDEARARDAAAEVGAGAGMTNDDAVNDADLAVPRRANRLAAYATRLAGAVVNEALELKISGVTA